MKKILLVLTGFLWLGNIYAQEDENHQTQIMLKMASLRSALLNKDSVTFSRILADDLTYGHSTSVTQSKQELISSVMSGQQQYRSIEPSDMKIRIYDNSAVVTAKAKVKLIWEGKLLDLSLNLLLVWVKQGNEWKLVARQSVSNI
jgi:hypothetical protein